MWNIWWFYRFLSPEPLTALYPTSAQIIVDMSPSGTVSHISPVGFLTDVSSVRGWGVTILATQTLSSDVDDLRDESDG